MIKRVIHFFRYGFDLQPFEIYLAAVGVLSGISLLVIGAAPASIDQLLPPLLVHLWGANLVLGGAFTLVGLFWPHAKSEEFGLALTASATIVYGVVIVLYAGWSGVFPALLLCGYGLACLRRRATLRRLVANPSDRG